MSVRITAKARKPRSVIVTVPGPQGPSGTANLGTVTVVNPDQNPDVVASGTARDRVFSFLLPRAAAVDVGTVSTLNPDQSPTVSSTIVDGDVDYNFGLPRAASFTVNDNVVSPNVNPSVTTVVTDGDIDLTFDLPRTATLAVGSVTVVNPDVSPDVTTNVDPDGDVTFDFDLPDAPEVALGTVTTVNPDVAPDVSFTVTDGNVEVDFELPRAADVTLGTVTPVNPDTAPDVSFTVLNGDVEIDFDLPRAPAFTVGTIQTVNPNVVPNVSDSGIDGDINLDFDIPRAPTVNVLTPATVLNPDQNPSVSGSTTVDGDLEIEFDLPRAPTFAVGTVNTVGPSDPADATDVGTDGDIVINFDLPRGEKGWAPILNLVVDSARRVLQVDDWAGGEGTKPATGDYIGATGLVSDIALAVDIRGEQGPAGVGEFNDLLDVNLTTVTDGQFVRFNNTSGNWENTGVDTDAVSEGSTNLYYTDQRADDRIAASDTDDISEGATNLYYTDARVETVISNSDTDDLAEGSSNLYYTDARVEAIAAPLYFTENVQTGNYTLALSDVAKVVAMNNSASATVTVPLDASVEFPVGTVINVYAMTANTVTVEGASGVTVRNDGDIADQYVEVSLRKRGTDEWVLSGNVS
jgi:hypothetical protein